VPVQQTGQFTVTLRDAAGAIVTGRPVSWSAVPTTIATVSAAGTVTGVAIGQAQVTATSEGVSGHAAVTVTPFSFGAGMRLVGTQVPPGLYRSLTAQDGFCYWARLSGLGGTTAEIIANDIGGGPRLVSIAATDLAFSSSGCAPWVAVVGGVRANPTAPLPTGVYLVPAEVTPGTWQSSGSGGSCYFARLRGFSGNVVDIIANDLGPEPRLVTIAPTDVGFRSSGCGPWVRQP
jgi:hypothetical protein